MKTYVSMIRGINVSGQKKIKMDHLQALFVALGHSDVATYIQSGNVVFKGSVTKPSDVARGIEQRIAHDLSLDVTVLIRTRDGSRR